MGSNLKEFVLNNLDLIISLLILCFSFIWNVKTSITSHKKNMFSTILRCVPFIVAEAENCFEGVSKAGEKKMEYCLQKLEAICIQKNVVFNYDEFKKIIEAILTAPTKIKKEITEDEKIID